MRFHRTTLFIALLLAACATAPLGEGSITDDEIAARVQEALAKDLDLMRTNISANAVNGTVTLDGEVRLDSQRQRATIVAQGVSGVRSVINNIHLSR